MLGIYKNTSSYSLNGSQIFSFHYLNTTNPIAADIDNDNVLDLVWTISSQTKVFDTNATSADLEILEIIPIQVVRGVDMVLGKTGLVRVNIRNNGPLDANATAKVNFEGSLLYDWDVGNNTNITKLINANQNASFDFRFKPGQTGTQTFVANVSVG